MQEAFQQHERDWETHLGEDLFKGRDGIRRKTKTKTNETKPTLQEAFQQRGITHNHQQSSADHHKGNPTWQNQALEVVDTIAPGSAMLDFPCGGQLMIVDEEIHDVHRSQTTRQTQ
jgi:hypothetical protein